MTCVLCVYVCICLVALSGRCNHMSYVSVVIVAPVVPFLTNGSLLSFLFSLQDVNLIVCGSFLVVWYDFLTRLLGVFPAQHLDSANSLESPTFFSG